MVASPMDEQGPGTLGRGRDGESDESVIAGFGGLLRGLMALGSVGVLVGVGWWSYGLAVRDPAEVPVIRALPEPIRERPARPERSDEEHARGIGEVQALGRVPPPGKEVVIERPVEIALPATTPQGRAGQPSPIASRSSATTHDVPPVEVPPPLAGEDAMAAFAQADMHGAAPAVARKVDGEMAAPAAGPGVEDQAAAPVEIAIRPRPRPATRTHIRSTAKPVREASANLAARLTPGMAMVQLGAFASPAEAEAAWRRFQRSQGDLLRGRPHHVLEYVRGNKRYYRLRVSGFDNFSEATRFCKAYAARGGECIPVIYK